MNFRSKFSDRLQVISPVDEKSRTQQHFKDDCDINVIWKRYQRTGVVTHIARVREVYGEFDPNVNFGKVFADLSRAQEMFEQLPAAMRGRFLNDPKGFYEFIADPANKDECIRLGIFDKPAEPAPEKVQKVEVVNVPPAEDQPTGKPSKKAP